MDKDFILILTIVESAQIILKYFVTSLQQNVNDRNFNRERSGLNNYHFCGGQSEIDR